MYNNGQHKDKNWPAVKGLNKIAVTKFQNLGKCTINFSLYLQMQKPFEQRHFLAQHVAELSHA